MSIALVSVTGCTTPDGRPIYFQTKCNEDTLFKMGSLICPVSEGKLYLVNSRGIYGNVAGVDMWANGFDTDTVTQSLKSSVIAHLCKVYVLCNYAVKEGIELTDEEKATCLLAAKEYYATLNSAELEFTGCVEADIETMYENYALAEKVNSALMSSVDDEVSEDEARVMEAYVIFVKDSETLVTVQQKLSEGNSFEKVAANYTALDTYDITFPRGQYSPEIDNIVFNLDNGEVSAPIQADSGVYFFKCKSKYNEKLSEENKTTIVEKRKQQVIDSIQETMSSELFSDFNTKAWEDVNLEDALEFTSDSFFVTLRKYLSY